MRSLLRFNSFSVDFRYPGENGTFEESQETFKVAKKARRMLRKILKLK
jgi:hypothetical protein